MIDINDESLCVHFIYLLNSIISEAIEHGGDSGGAYYSNPEGLLKEMKYFLNWTGLNKTVGIMNYDNGDMKFYMKRFIVEE